MRAKSSSHVGGVGFLNMDMEVNNKLGTFLPLLPSPPFANHTTLTPVACVQQGCAERRLGSHRPGPGNEPMLTHTRGARPYQSRDCVAARYLAELHLLRPCTINLPI